MSSRDLVRFALSLDDIIVPDITERLPGRGIWVSSQREILQKIEKKDFFSRAFKKKVEIPANIVEATVSASLAYVISLFALARKAGVVASGCETVKKACCKKPAAVYCLASDYSAASLEKIPGFTRDVSKIGCLDRYELGQVFGADHIVYAALFGHNRLILRIVREAGRLGSMRCG
jgi:predicted RNA-binding protein YlxR (DUF448 family)